MGVEESEGDGELEKRDHSGFSSFTQRAAVVMAMVTFAVVGLFFAWQMITLILVLFLAILFAIFLRGLTKQLAKRTRLNEHWSLFVVTFILIVGLGGGGLLAAPAVSEQASQIAETVPEALDELQRLVENTSVGQRIRSELSDLNLGEIIGGETLGQVGGAVFGVVGGLSHVLFVVFVGIYFAYDPDVYKRGIVRVVPMNHRRRAEEIIDACTYQLTWWLIGRLVSMLAVAVITTLGLWLLGVPLSVVLGLIAGLFSFVPVLGPIVSVVPAALIALLVGPEYVIWVVLLFMGAQAVEGYLVTPMVQHRFVSLPHAITLIAEVFAGLLFGIIGVTVATPLAVLMIALINMIYVEDVLGDRTPFTDLVEDHT